MITKFVKMWNWKCQRQDVLRWNSTWDRFLTSRCRRLSAREVGKLARPRWPPEVQPRNSGSRSWRRRRRRPRRLRRSPTGPSSSEISGHCQWPRRWSGQAWPGCSCCSEDSRRSRARTRSWSWPWPSGATFSAGTSARSSSLGGWRTTTARRRKRYHRLEKFIHLYVVNVNRFFRRRPMFHRQRDLSFNDLSRIVQSVDAAFRRRLQRRRRQFFENWRFRTSLAMFNFTS